MLTDTVNNRIPRAKSWNKVETQRANMATLTTTTTMLPPVDIRTCVSKFLDFFQSFWNTFSVENTQNSLLQSRSEIRKDSYSNLQGNLGLFIDSFLGSQLLPSEEQDSNLGISLLKSLEFEKLIKSGITYPFKGLPISSGRRLHSPNCDLIFNPSKEHSLFLQCSIKTPKLRMEEIVCHDMSKNMHKPKLTVSPQEKSLCPFQPLKRDVQSSPVNIQMVIQVLPRSETNLTATEVTNNHMNMLNRELITRKSKQMIKSSKNRRRRQRKKDRKVEQLTTESQPNNLTSTSSQEDSDLDDVDIIFEDLICPEVSADSSVKSDDFCIEFYEDEIGTTKPLNSSFNESVSSDDFSVDFCDGEDEVDMPKSTVRFSKESVSSDDFSVDFCDGEDDADASRCTNHSFNTSASSDDFCIEFCTEGDEVDGCIVSNVFLEQEFTSESEEESDLNCSYDDDAKFEELDFSIGTCFMSSLSSTCVAFSRSSIISGSCNELPEMSPELRLVNEQWQKEILNVPSESKSSKQLTKKVSFAPDQELVTVFPVEAYNRKGEWETYALERFRFKRRIEEVEKIISPCLSKSHRDKVLLRLQANLASSV